MTKYDIEERRLRRLEKRIRHLAALLNLSAVMGGGSVSRQLRQRVRGLYLTESARLWEITHPDGEPEDMARKAPAGR